MNRFCLIALFAVATCACSSESDPPGSTDSGAGTEAGESDADTSDADALDDASDDASDDADSDDGAACLPEGTQVDSADCSKCCYGCSGFNDNFHCKGP